MRNIEVHGMYPSLSMARYALEKIEKEDFNNTDVAVHISTSDGTGESHVYSDIRGPALNGTRAGVPGVLMRQSPTSFAARRYGGRVSEGGILLSVHTGSIVWGEKAKEILIDTGAEDISKRSIAQEM